MAPHACGSDHREQPRPDRRVPPTTDLNPPPSYPARLILAGLTLITLALGAGALLVQAVRG